MMGIVLKPCPFCGASDPKLIDSIAERRWRVDCQDCTASVSTAFKASTIAMWNKRAAQEVDAPAAPQICPICGGKGGHIEGHDGIMSGGGESVWVDCEACEGHGWVKPAPADPFMPSPEVRAALQAVFRDDKPLNRYGGTAEKIADWVRSWPQ